MKKTVVFLVIAALFASASAFATEISSLMPVLKQVKKDTNATLLEIDKDLKAAAKELANVDLKSDAARKILNGLRKFRPYVVDCSILNADGIKITVEPETYRQYENADRSGLPYVIELLKTKKPVLSNVYASEEVGEAISIGYPIISDKGELLGAVKMLVKHEVFLKPLASDKPCKVWVMQPNGLIIYDEDPDQIGKNIFTDPFFKSFEDLISFAKTVALSSQGAGSYDFYVKGLADKTIAKKIAVWDTVGLYGTEWRIVAMDMVRLAENRPAEEKQPVNPK